MSDDGYAPNMPLPGARFPEIAVKTTHGMKDLPGGTAGGPQKAAFRTGAELPLRSVAAHRLRQHRSRKRATNGRCARHGRN